MNLLPGLSDPNYLNFLKLMIGIMAFGVVIIGILNLIPRSRSEAKKVWTSFSPWFFMLPVIFLAVGMTREVLIVSLLLLSIFAVKEFSRATGLYEDWGFISVIYLGIIGLFKKKRIYNNGFIGYRYASSPGGKWSDEIPLFVQGPFIDQKISGTINLRKLHPDLKKITYFTEPGALEKDGVLYLSLDARSTYELKNFKYDRVILLSSKDHGRTWKYLGTLTDHQDATEFGYFTFTGSSLVASKGKHYLMTSPSGSLKPPHQGHVGAYIFEFEDLNSARLKRDRKGKLIIKKHIKPQWNKGGQAHYDDGNYNGGIVIPQQNDSQLPDVFRLFSTNEFP